MNKFVTDKGANRVFLEEARREDGFKFSLIVAVVLVM